MAINDDELRLIKDILARLEQEAKDSPTQSEDRQKASASIVTALSEIAVILSDYFEAAQKPKNEDELAALGRIPDALREAVAAIRVDATFSPTFNVAAPSVTVQSPVVNNAFTTPEIKVPAAVVQVVESKTPKGARWRFEVEHNGMTRSVIHAERVA